MKLSDFKVGEKVTVELHQGRRQDGRNLDQACDLTTAITIGVVECELPVKTGGFASR